jgi:hypothetical protein
MDASAGTKKRQFRTVADQRAAQFDCLGRVGSPCCSSRECSDPRSPPGTGASSLICLLSTTLARRCSRGPGGLLTLQAARSRKVGTSHDRTRAKAMSVAIVTGPEGGIRWNTSRDSSLGRCGPGGAVPSFRWPLPRTTRHIGVLLLRNGTPMTMDETAALSGESLPAQPNTTIRTSFHHTSATRHRRGRRRHRARRRWPPHRSWIDSAWTRPPATRAAPTHAALRPRPVCSTSGAHAGRSPGATAHEPAPSSSHARRRSPRPGRRCPSTGDTGENHGDRGRRDGLSARPSDTTVCPRSDAAQAIQIAIG